MTGLEVIRRYVLQEFAEALYLFLLALIADFDSAFIEYRPCRVHGRRGSRRQGYGIRRSRRPFQGHRLVTLDVEAREAVVDVPPGSWLVRTAQPLGTLIVCMLEPQSEDGLAAWNFLDEHLTEGEPYPILRVNRPSDLTPRSLSP